MPAINVAKTDTFEIFRQKVNQIGSQIFNISEGGSDLATGNLKLGDGTRTLPSLAFTSDFSLGIYKPSPSTIGYVASGKKIADFSASSIYSFKDLIVQQNTINTSGISLLNKGTNYDAGSYTDVPLIGGTGDGATIDITVTEFGGEIISGGSNYNEGSYVSIPLVGGSGTGSIVNFDIEGIQGFISNPGSGYIPEIYNNVPLNGGSGTGALANITVTGEILLNGNISSPGSGYTEGSYFAVELLNKPIQTFIVTTTTNPGSPPPDNVYVIDGEIQKQLTLVKGNTYRFDLSDSSNNGHPLIFQSLTGEFLSQENYVVIQKGSAGSAGAFVDLIVKPSAETSTIKYNCSNHDGMGANISIVSGIVGIYGSSLRANLVINSSGIVSSIEFINAGDDYKENDILEVYNIDIGGTGSGFEYTLSAPTYTGEITNVIIQNNGTDYIIGDILSANSVDLGGFGSGFTFTIDNNPGVIENIEFISKGNGYQVNDELQLPKSIAGVATQLKSVVTGISTILSNSSASITVADTTGIFEGMIVSQDLQNDVGFLSSQETTVLSVDSGTQITLSVIPDVSGQATLTFTSPGNILEIEVPSVEGILIGSTIQQTAGTGSLASNTIVDSINSESNIITLSTQPLQAGTATLDIIPPFGDPVSDFNYEILNLGEVESYSITSGGNGYSISDQLNVNPSDLIQPINYSVINRSVIIVDFVDNIPVSTFSVGNFVKLKDGEIVSFLQTQIPSTTQTVISNISTTLSDSSPIISVADTTGIVQGMIVSQDSQNDIGILQFQTTVASVDSSTQITLSQIPASSGPAALEFSSDESGSFTNVPSTSSGNGVNATFDIERDSFGNILSIVLSSGGNFYDIDDTVTISGVDVGGLSPDHDIILSLTDVSSSQELEILDIKDDGVNITSLLLDFDIINSGDYLILSGTFNPEYEINNVSDLGYRYFIDIGNGFELTPSFTLYVGSVYRFDLSDSSNASHQFSLSSYRGGIWGPSLIENIEATLVTTSNQISVSNTTGILPGMSVSVSSGTGALVGETKVESVNGNTITLSNFPLTAGSVILTFTGVEYTDGVLRTASSLTIQVTQDTPNLYYYCGVQDNSHANEGGENDQEALITIDLNNPKTFGSGFLLSVAELDTNDIITANIQSGNLSAVKFTGEEAEISDISVSNTLTSSAITANDISVNRISSSNNLEISSNSTNISGNLNIGNNIQIISSTGNITTSGVLKTTNSLNINDGILITNNVISSTSGNNIILSPSSGRVAKVNTTTALTIPSGTTAQRPSGGIVENGSIRYNTETNQYEGYSGSTGSWSSLGGIRDLDGNTTILAEESVGVNDNTLWLINDNVNTIKFTPQYQEFVNVKKIRSVNTSAPNYVEWTSNTQVDAGDYLKYRNNIFEVITSGTTATSGSEPVNTSGNIFPNGTATLQYFTSAVAQLTFEEISQLNIDPLGFTDLVVNGELRFSNNVISTDVNDLIIRPNSGQKVSVNSNTSLVIPVGDSNSRGNAAQGSIRFNTSISQYEGYDGANWSSLGGVRDVDGNTYIVPELSAGSNENILYFFNNNTNTLRVTETQLEFDTIDTIVSESTSTLNINVSTITFDSLATTLDNTSTSETFLFTTKENFDLGLSSGLVVDPLLRLTDIGEVYYNLGFGTGFYDGVRLLDSDLKEFELSDYKLVTRKVSLERGLINSGSAVIYDPAIHAGAKVEIVAYNTTTGDKEFIEYSVIDKGTDIFHTEFGNIKTGAELISTVFDFNANNNVRVTFTLSSALATGNNIQVTVVSNIIKR